VANTAVRRLRRAEGSGGGAALIVSRTGALEPGYGPALRSVAIWAPLSLIAAGVVIALTTPAGRRT
jgi:hypothetical protein